MRTFRRRCGIRGGEICRRDEGEEEDEAEDGESEGDVCPYGTEEEHETD